MPTFTKSNSKYSLLKSFIVTLLRVVFVSKLISSVKEFCLMSDTGTLLFPNLITSGDTVCYQKFWVKFVSFIPLSQLFLLVFADWQLEGLW